MKRLIAASTALTALFLLPLHASAASVDDAINNVMGPITDVITSIIFWSIQIGEFSVPFVLIWLFFGALFFTVYFKFVNIRAFRHALDVVRGKFDDPNHQGEVSHFQALTAALSGTVGVGNIAGVAVAVSLGGPGATFWMIIAGLFGMSSKFVECTLGLKYRRQNPDGSVSGGPMYYLRDGLAKKGNAGLGKVLAALFAIAAGPFRGGCQSAPRPLVESAPPRGVEGRLALPSGSRRRTRASRGRRDSPRRAAVLHRILRPRRARPAAPQVARLPRKRVFELAGNSPFNVTHG